MQASCLRAPRVSACAPRSAKVLATMAGSAHRRRGPAIPAAPRPMTPRKRHASLLAPIKAEQEPQGELQAVPMDESRAEELKTVFNMIDTNGNGFISSEELLAFMIAMGGSQEEVADMIAEADVNGDGKLSFDEFAKIMLEL